MPEIGPPLRNAWVYESPAVMSTTVLSFAASKAHDSTAAQEAEGAMMGERSLYAPPDTCSGYSLFGVITLGT